MPQLQFSSLRVLLAVALFCVALGSARATVITSTFDAGTEGWTAFPAATSTDPSFVASGGNPGGYLQVEDVDAQWGYVRAPTPFRRPALYGGTLQFDLFAETGDPANFPVIYGTRAALFGDGIYIVNELAVPGDVWSTYRFDLVETSGWRVFTDINQNYTTAAPLVTEVQLRGLLADLQEIYIATDYSDAFRDGGSLDRTGIDNVRLDTVMSVDAPATLGMLAMLLWTAALRRRC